jgi:microcystin-dependent protein
MAKVLFTRTDTNDKVETIPFKDGQIIYTKDGKTYLDYGTERVELISGGDTIPIASVMPFAEVNSTSPIMSDWLLCDGRAVSRTIYSELFSLIGTTYGAGDGSTTFNLPDVKGRVIVGQDESDDDFKTVGAKLGTKEVTLTVAQMPSHGGHVVGSLTTTLAQSGTGIIGTINPEAFGGDEAHNNIQPTIVLKYYIKAFRSASLTADVKNTKTTSTKDVYSCHYINDNLESLKYLQGFKTYLESNTIVIEPTIDVYAIVEASWGIWGNNGAEISLDIATPDGATLIKKASSHTNGHNGEAVPVTVVGHYMLPAGSRYYFTANASVGTLGGVKGNYIKAVTMPKMD